MKNSENNYYSHSGNYKFTGPILMIIFGMMAAVALSGVYSYITLRFLYLNPVFTLFFSLLLGTFIGGGAKIGKVRNIKVCSVVSILISIFAIYVVWVIWFHLHKEVFFGNPKDLFLAMNDISKTNHMRLGNIAVGKLVWIIWGIELVIIIALTHFTACDYIKMTPFCESCKKWVNEIKSCHKEYIKAPDKLKVLLEKQDFKSIHQLKNVNDHQEKYSLLMATSCSSCQNLHLLSITNIGEGEENTFIDNLYIPQKDFDLLFAENE